MKLKKASAWYYNKGKTHVVINELGITLHQGVVVDLFVLNPHLSWEQYRKSATNGVLSQKKLLVHLNGPPKSNPPPYVKPVASSPIRSRSKSSLILGKDREDYLATIESDFDPNSQPMAEKELWKEERNKYIEQLEQFEYGEDGELFSDKMFDEEYLSNLTD